MKVAKWYNNRDIRIEDDPRPVPGEGELLVKINSCGICGSDVVEWYRLPRAPLVPGHEIGGQVVAVGKSVEKFKPGDRVFVAPKVPCLECDYCKKDHYPVCANVKDRLPGGFSEYIRVPSALVQTGTYLLPDGMTYDQSTFIEPLACVIRAQRLAGLQKDQALVVIGCGMSGLLHVKIARTLNCRIAAIDIQPARLQYAKEFGAEITLDASAGGPDLSTAGNEIKADVVMLCTSTPSAVDQAWKFADKGGAVVFFSVPAPDEKVCVPINDFWMKEIRILTSYYCSPADITTAIQLISTGAVVVDDMITHILPLQDIARGYQLVADGRTSMKVIIRP